jgi:hypothetical protein
VTYFSTAQNAIRALIYNPSAILGRFWGGFGRFGGFRGFGGKATNAKDAGVAKRSAQVSRFQGFRVSGFQGCIEISDVYRFRRYRRKNRVL